MKQRRFIALLAMVLVLVLCVSMLAACNKCDGNHVDADKDGKCDKCGEAVTIGGGDSGMHTYYTAMTQSPSTWNPHMMKSTTDSMPLDYTTNSLYEFAYNDTMDGYEIVPVMAAADPVDVSKEYAKFYDPINDDTSKSYGLKFDIEAIDEEEYNTLLADGEVQVFADTYTMGDLIDMYIDYGYTYEEALADLGFESETDAFAAYEVADKDAFLAVEITDYYKATTYDSGRAFRIALNPDAKWENGEPITADDWIYSMKALLDPQLANYRASNYYSGSLVIHNAKNYVYSGQTIMVSDENLEDPTFMAGKDLYFSKDVENYLFKATGLGAAYDCENSFESLYTDGFVNYYIGMATAAFEKGEDVDKNLPVANYDSADAYADAFVEYKMTGAGSNAARLAIANLYAYLTSDDVPVEEDGPAEGYIKLTGNETLKGLLNEVTKNLYSGSEYAELMASYVGAYPETTFDQVGLKKIDDYTIDIIVDNELVGFYIKYNLGTSWLVYEDLYEACKVQDATGAWSSKYGTSVDTYMSYGPYKVTKFLDGQQMVFDRNENWFGYTDKYADTYGTFVRGIDGEVCKQYETDRIVVTQVNDISTREQMFLKGQLEGLGLDTELLSKYRTSDAIYFTEGETTFYGILCSDMEKLTARQEYESEKDGKEINKTILTIKEFRQALCYSIDRAGLCAALYPAGTPAYGLFSNAVMADPANSVSYRSLEAAKIALCNFWGVEYGAGKEYATLDDAYDAITGYDLAQAKELIDIAYDKAIEEGLMTENAIVRLTYCASSESPTETKWYNTFKDNFINLMKGTKLEGKFEYDSDFTLGNKFGDKISGGDCDTAWGFGWNGGVLDPYGLFEVYVDASYNSDGYQYDSWVDWDLVDLTLTLDYDYATGKADETTYTYSVTEWACLLFGNPDYCEALGQKWTFGNVPDSVRSQILAKLEEAVLLNYTTIPMMNEGSVQLKSYKINYGQEDYIYGVGRGGIRYTTYNYTDAEWEAYLKEVGGTLKY